MFYFLSILVFAFHSSIFHYEFVAAKNVLNENCKACFNISQQFFVGLKKTANSNYGGGNSAWEESKLPAYATSETRLVIIMEKVCNQAPENEERDKCHAFIDKHESDIEKWWLNDFKNAPNANHHSANIYSSLCVEKWRYCCPLGRFGPNCEQCDVAKQDAKNPPRKEASPADSLNSCGNRGRCDGNGTRSGTGRCVCEEGYDGRWCGACKTGWWRSAVETEKEQEKGGAAPLKCERCNAACGASGCESGRSASHCLDCAAGYEPIKLEQQQQQEQQQPITSQLVTCQDIDECSSPTASSASSSSFSPKKKRCSGNTFCENTPGSFRCVACDPACGPTGECFKAGPAGCVGECGRGYHRSGSAAECEDINECSEDSRVCRGKHEKCINTPGAFRCQCRSGFQRDGKTALCVQSKTSSASSTSSSSTSKTSRKTSQNPADDDDNNNYANEDEWLKQQKAGRKKRPPPKKIWTRKYEREFFKVVLALIGFLLSCWLLKSRPLVMAALSVALAYFLFRESISLDKIFSGKK